jgi:hypothetical protein
VAAPQVVGIEHVSGDGGVELKYFTKAMYEQMQIRGITRSFVGCRRCEHRVVEYLP